MPDREKVKYDIERCICHVPDACRDCSHYKHGEYLDCMEELLKDAMELLKEQERTINELQNAYGYLQKQFFEAQDKLLKEQEAVEPIPFYTETGAESPNYVICGHCKSIKAIMPKNTKQKYCHECGFPVLWEGR